MTTTSRIVDVRDALNSGNPAAVASAHGKIKAGNMASLIKVTFASLTSSATQDITTAAAKAAITASDGITLKTGENLPAIGHVVSLRVTAGTLAAGPSLVTDSGGTATAIGALACHVSLLSADGTTLTFQAAVTGFVLWYYPKEYVDLDTAMPPGAP